MQTAKYGISHVYLMIFDKTRGASVSKFFDFLAIFSFFSLGFVMDLPYTYYLGCLLASVGIFLRYYFVAPSDLSKIPVVFMYSNAYFSFVFFIFTLISVM